MRRVTHNRNILEEAETSTSCSLQWHFEREPDSLEFSPDKPPDHCTGLVHLRSRAGFPGILPRPVKRSCISRAHVTCSSKHGKLPGICPRERKEKRMRPFQSTTAPQVASFPQQVSRWPLPLRHLHHPLPPSFPHPKPTP